MLAELSPWAGLAVPGRHGGALAGAAGVTIGPAGSGAMALLGARRGKLEGLMSAARALGVDLPTRPAWIQSRAVTFLWAGPERWLMRAPGAFAGLARDWAPLNSCAVLIDQSHARACLRLTGPQTRAVLAKGFEIDLHPRAFSPGDLALTTVALMPALIWQLDDQPSYEIAVPRSYAASFWHWLTGSAEEYGYGVEEAMTGAGELAS